jgi:hypothetical protein
VSTNARYCCAPLPPNSGSISETSRTDDGLECAGSNVHDIKSRNRPSVVRSTFYRKWEIFFWSNSWIIASLPVSFVDGIAFSIDPGVWRLSEVLG